MLITKKGENIAKKPSTIWSYQNAFTPKAKSFAERDTIAKERIRKCHIGYFPQNSAFLRDFDFTKDNKDVKKRLFATCKHII